MASKKSLGFFKVGVPSLLVPRPLHAGLIPAPGDLAAPQHAPLYLPASDMLLGRFGKGRGELW